MTSLPSIPGVLTPEQIDATGAAIAAMQDKSGAVPWFPGGKTDPWDHVESAMALSATGRIIEAEAAYDWSRLQQRADGSWPIRIVGDRVEDANIDSNFCAYIAVGVWHHFLITRDAGFLERMWQTVRSAIDLVMRFRRTDGVFRWGGDYFTGDMFEEARITGNASIFHALDCAARIADHLGRSDEQWRGAHTELGTALRDRAELFEPPSDHAMDWYYPILGGAVRRSAGDELIASRWSDFVVPGKGIRCVDHRPWVTGAETCELALTLDTLDQGVAATDLVDSIQHLRDPDGSYWTGLVYADGKRWPVEKSSWTSAAVVLAADAISRTTAGSGIFRDIRTDAEFGADVDVEAAV